MEQIVDSTRSRIMSLVNLNNKKISSLRKLHEVTKQQSIDISTSSLNSLLDHIKEKQDIINSIDEIDKAFYDGFVELKLMLGVKSIEDISIEEYPEVSVLKSSVENIMLEVADIDKLDKQNLDEVHREIDKLKKDMKKIQTQTKVVKNYGVTTNNSYGKDYQGFYIDGKK